MKARTNVQVTLRMKRSMQDDMNGPLEWSTLFPSGTQAETLKTKWDILLLCQT
jgi:hypothetical protein